MWHCWLKKYWCNNFYQKWLTRSCAIPESKNDATVNENTITFNMYMNNNNPIKKPLDFSKIEIDNITVIIKTMINSLTKITIKWAKDCTHGFKPVIIQTYSYNVHKFITKVAGECFLRTEPTFSWSILLVWISHAKYFQIIRSLTTSLVSFSMVRLLVMYKALSAKLRTIIAGNNNGNNPINGCLTCPRNGYLCTDTVVLSKLHKLSGAIVCMSTMSKARWRVKKPSRQ